VNAITDCILGLKAVNTCKEPACSDFTDLQLKPDVFLFKSNFNLNDFQNKSYFSVMKMWIEFKHEQAPFADPSTDKEITNHDACCTCRVLCAANLVLQMCIYSYCVFSCPKPQYMLHIPHFKYSSPQTLKYVGCTTFSCKIQ